MHGMIAIGRISSTLVVLASMSIAMVATVLPGLEHVGTIHVLDWLGGTLYLAAPLSWITAMVHWAKRFPRGGRRAAWGFGVVLGFVPGAILYWLWGSRATPEAPLGEEPARAD